MLAYLLLSKVATLTQSNLVSVIFPCENFYLTTGREILAGIAVFASIAIFARLRHLDVFTSWRMKRTLHSRNEKLVLVTLDSSNEKKLLYILGPKEGTLDPQLV